MRHPGERESEHKKSARKYEASHFGRLAVRRERVTKRAPRCREYQEK